MVISLIAALTINRVIGANNAVPWYLPLDIAWFKYHTLYKPVIMGRRTFESIGMKPLQNRINIVISRVLLNDYNGVYIVKNIHQALFLVNDFYEVMVIGGSVIYDMFLPYANRLYLTYIGTTVCICGDTWFPIYDISEWKSIFSTYFNTYEKNDRYNLSFNIFERL